MIGRLEKDSVEMFAGASLNIFDLVSGYLKGRGQVIKAAFNEFDDDGSGTLDMEEVGHLVKKVLPTTAAMHVKFVQVMPNVP
jgi:Ca2+-binding EF-hand superfamily protein